MKIPAILIASVLTLSGCASAPPQALQFVAAPATTLAPPPPDKAQIVFVMPKNLFVEAAVVGLYDVRENDRTLMAMVPSHGKTVQLVTPGRHRFMTNFGAAGTHIMDADVAAGKRYYVLMRFIYGQGFQLRPIRAAGPSDYSVQNTDFPTWLSSTRFVEKTSDADTWYAANKVRIDAFQTTSLAVWNKKTPQQQAELTLNSGDAIAQ